MNANRSSTDSTSLMGNESISNIKKNMELADKRRASKRDKIKKAASTPMKKKASINKSGRLVIANLSEIPTNFERIGTGFYRQGHHLWELAPADNGFILIRKRGEDHVLGYDPEPITKVAASTTDTDRFGITIKVGSRVQVPHHGKLAQGTVYLVSPNSMGMELDNGERIDAPPDMLEIVNELIEGLISFVEEEADGDRENESIEESKEEDNEDDDEEDEDERSESGGFEPGVEPSSKSASRNGLSKDTLTKWGSYWRSVGERAAQVTPKSEESKPVKPPGPKSPKIPGQLTPEQKEKRRQTRKDRRQTMKGLPPGTRIPSR
ncbi:hypothetical protein LCGC14_2559140, partial [marine sediment metagenome]